MPINLIAAAVSPTSISPSDVQQIELDSNILGGPILVIFVAMFLPILAYFILEREIKMGVFPFFSGGVAYVVLYATSMLVSSAISLLIPGDTAGQVISIIVSLLLEAAIMLGVFGYMRIFRTKLPQTAHGVGAMLGYSFGELTFLVATPAIITLMTTYSMINLAQSGTALSQAELIALAGAGSLGLSDYIASSLNCIVWIVARTGVGVMLWLAATRQDSSKALIASLVSGALISLPSILNQTVGIGVWPSVAILSVVAAAIWFAAIKLQGMLIDNPIIKKYSKKRAR